MVQQDMVQSMAPEGQINEFLSRLRQAAGENLESAILYGSAAGGEFHPEFSNVNLLCILGDASFARLAALAPAVAWWNRHKHPAPLVLTRQDLEHSADVFAIELLDMQQRHRVLFGPDPLSGLHIPMNRHRAQVEYELREKLILLRERVLLAAGNQNRLWELLLGSLPSFATLFRHALIALGGPAVDSKRAGLEALSRRIPFDASALLQLLDLRERKAARSQFDVSDTFTRYLAAIEQVAAAVDTMLDSSGSRE
jgi:hypothetical protein